MCRRRLSRIRLAITLCGESGLFFAMPGLSYYVIILGGSSRGPGGGEGGGRRRQVMHRHPLRVRIRALRKDEVGGSMILRYYGETVLRKVDKKIPLPLGIYVWEIPHGMDDDEAAVTSLCIWIFGGSVLHVKVLVAINASDIYREGRLFEERYRGEKEKGDSPSCRIDSSLLSKFGVPIALLSRY